MTKKALTAAAVAALMTTTTVAHAAVPTETQLEQDKQALLVEMQNELENVPVVQKSLVQEIMDYIARAENEDELWEAFEINFDQDDENEDDDDDFGPDLDEDERYEDEGDFDDPEYDFATERAEILAEVQEMIGDTSGDTQTKLQAAYAELNAAETEDAFWNTYDALYDQHEAEIEAYFYELDRTEIIADLEAELAEANPEAREIIQAELDAINATQTEEEFWNVIDSMYEYEDEDDMYEDDENYDFGTERTEVLAELEAEIAALTQLVGELEQTADEEQFWDTLDDFYDSYYEDEDDDDDDFDFDFDWGDFDDEDEDEDDDDDRDED